MLPVKIGILAHDFMEWGGGVDFLWLVTDCLLATPRSQSCTFHLLVPDSGFRLKWRMIRRRAKSLLKKEKFNDPRTRSATVSAAFAGFGDRIKIEHIGIGHRALEQAAKRLNLDALIPAVHSLGKNFPTPWVGYAYDFQHKYFPQYFSAESQKSRDEHFADMLTTAKVVIVNSKAAAADIAKFVPQATARVVSLPLCPAPAPQWLNTVELSASNRVVPPYFIICNQFWAHKGHMTAFQAFAKVAKENPKLSLVCTGSTESTDPSYVPSLIRFAEKSGLSDRIKLLGLIPKREQIELLKNAVAVVQPTLFEGGPGGGSVYDAIAVGLPAIVSDIPVNLELQGMDVTFFPANDSETLAQRMREQLAAPKKKIANETLIANGRQRRASCGEVLWQAIDAVR
jgi:glycosyltransferase involved in cell wall biosynthesis